MRNILSPFFHLAIAILVAIVCTFFFEIGVYAHKTLESTLLEVIVLVMKKYFMNLVKIIIIELLEWAYFPAFFSYW